MDKPRHRDLRALTYEIQHPTRTITDSDKPHPDLRASFKIPSKTIDWDRITDYDQSDFTLVDFSLPSDFTALHRLHELKRTASSTVTSMSHSQFRGSRLRLDRTIFELYSRQFVYSGGDGHTNFIPYVDLSKPSIPTVPEHHLGALFSLLLTT